MSILQDKCNMSITVGELINQLSYYPKDKPVLVYNGASFAVAHLVSDPEKQDVKNQPVYILVVKGV